MQHLRLPALAFSLFAVTLTYADDKQDKGVPGAAIVKMTPAQLLKLWDKNKDGYVDKQEAQVQPYFEQLDTNGDGKLDQNELGQLLEILKKRRLEQEAKAKGKNKGAGNELEREINAILQRLDANKDGKISREEAAGRPLAKAFDLLDRNKDGYLDRSELASWVQRAGKAGANKAGKAQPGAEISTRIDAPDFDALDKDADGRLTREELQGTNWADLFDKIDTNKDGKIDRKEFETYSLKQANDAAKPEPAKTDKTKKN